MGHKRVFGYFEVAFDILYLFSVLIAGVWLLFSGATRLHVLAGAMALILVAGDSFHLVPRIAAVVTGEEEKLNWALGVGKLVASISMTIFYVLLWHIGLLLYLPDGTSAWTVPVYILALLRIALCLFPQNKWFDRDQPVRWSIGRNIPFFLLGAAVAGLFWSFRGNVSGPGAMWLAIVLSFAFYLPVVLWVGRSPKLGMLMFPKTCAYVWIVLMCFGI